jgi:hypothetical protein
MGLGCSRLVDGADTGGAGLHVFECICLHLFVAKPMLCSAACSACCAALCCLRYVLCCTALPALPLRPTMTDAAAALAHRPGCPSGRATLCCAVPTAQVLYNRKPLKLSELCPEGQQGGASCELGRFREHVLGPYLLTQEAHR